MNTYKRDAPMGSVVVTYPETWTLREKYVADLVIPRELFGISTSLLRMTPTGSEQPRPLIQTLTASDIVIWAYYQLPGDPDPDHPDSLPNYSRWRPPLRYSDSEVFDSTAGREWLPSDFLWRRLGFRVGETRLTVWIWEGTSARSTALDEASAIVHSVNVL